MLSATTKSTALTFCLGCALSLTIGSARASDIGAALPLYGKDTPGTRDSEIVTHFGAAETVTRNVTYPTLSPVLPAPGTANGTAVIVLPGGGFQFLALENEGWRVAQALAKRGVTAFVLKYRTLPTPREDSAFLGQFAQMMTQAIASKGSPPDVKDPAATQDALAALDLVRAHAAQWHLDPHRVGLLGFSAGAMASMQATLTSSSGSDQRIAPPDFIGYIYGPMGKIDVPTGAPPMFAALAMDDPLFGSGDWSIASQWHTAGRPVELHVYQTGGHGFGLGKPDTTSTLLMDEFVAWLEMVAPGTARP